ncbi:MAG: MFS transporter [Alphaproteobacteria bacterium]
MLSGTVKSIGPLMIGAISIFLGNTILITMLPIRAQTELFTESAIGLMGTVHFAGFALGCMIGPWMVTRVGHIRCFAGFGALMATTILLFPLLVDPVGWSVMRGLGGICIAVLYLVIESWLNDSAGNEVRGAVLSVYIIATNAVTVGGQMMVNLFPIDAYQQFSMAAVFIILAVVPLTLNKSVPPKPVPEARLRIGRLWTLSPAGFVACISVGAIEGAFWTLGPVYAQGRGMPVSDITMFMAAFVVGGLVSQWPIGRMSDKIDRRWVIIACCLGTTMTALTLAYVDISTGFETLALAVLHGAFMLPLYPLSLAHTNDHAPNDELVEVSGGLLLLYAIGAITGPWAVGFAMEKQGDGSALFLVMAGVLIALVCFIVIRAFLRSAPTDRSLRSLFVPVPKTTQSVYSLETDD